MVWPIISGTIVERRDQVFTLLFMRVFKPATFRAGGRRQTALFSVASISLRTPLLCASGSTAPAAFCEAPTEGTPTLGRRFCTQVACVRVGCVHKCGGRSGALRRVRSNKRDGTLTEKRPFVDGHLREKVEGLNTRNEKKVVKTGRAAPRSFREDDRPHHRRAQRQEFIPVYVPNK